MRKIEIFFILIPLFSIASFGQNSEIKVIKSNKLDSIVKLRKELNSKTQNLRIQIYNGNRENAELIMKEYLEVFNDTSANIIYETPNYKIWVGDFFTQLEADRKLIKIRKRFRSAFIFRPEIAKIVDEIENEDSAEID
tara:strand:- start:34 stop:447 length:414 start_codon:yes stop_codon:yes gene_type:complete